MFFDRPIVPQGGVLHRAVVSNGQLGMTKEQLETSGYTFEDDKVKVVDDVPVGKAYDILQYWGGEKQVRRWHLAQPVMVNASRHGDPLFMDEGMIAFSAVWADGERYEAAMRELFRLFSVGVRGDGVVAFPLVVRVVWP